MEATAATATATNDVSPAAPHDAWRQELKPWLNALRLALLDVSLPSLPTVEDMRNLWLHVTAPTERRNTPTAWTLLMEAMELLDLLARVDQRAAWYLLLELTPYREMVTQYGDFLWNGRDENDVSPVIPQFRLLILDESMLEPHQNTLQGLIHMLIQSELQSSAKYKHAKQLLVNQYAHAHDGASLDRETQGRVKISLDFDIHMDLENEVPVGYLFSQIQDLAYAQADPSAIVLDAQAHTGGGGDDAGGGDGDAPGTGEEHDDEDEGEDGEEGDEEDDQDDSEEDEDEEDDGDEHEEDGDQDEGEEEDAEEEEEVEEEGATSHDDTQEAETRDVGEEQAATGDQKEEEGAAVGQRVRRQRGPFEFESFCIHLEGESPATNLVFYLLNEAGKSGMRFTHFTFTALVRAELHHSTIGGFLLNQLVPWRGRRDGFGVENLKLVAGQFDGAAVRALCTAIAHSRSLRELSFGTDDLTQPNSAGLDVWWPWLAYALFSGETDHEIDSVSLNMENLRMAHVHAIREILTHNDPLAFLYQAATAMESSSSDDEGDGDEAKQPLSAKSIAMNATLDPSALLRLGHYRVIAPDALDQVPSLRVREPGVSYQVVRNREGEDYIEFLLPGTGVCWTERSALKELKPIGRRDQHAVRHLTLSLLEDDWIRATIELLKLVGEPIEWLTINQVYDALPGDVMQSILACFPNLKRLDLTSVTVDGFEWLVDHRECKIETLCLQHVAVASMACWSTLFDALSDTVHPFTKSMRQLHFSLAWCSAEDMEGPAVQDALVAQCLAMLDANVALQRVELVRAEENVVTKYKERVAAHNNEPIAEEDAPLSIQEKFALLSALTPTQETAHQQSKKAKTEALAPSRVQYELDPNVVRSIMAFAATPKRRVCVLY